MPVLRTVSAARRRLAAVAAAAVLTVPLAGAAVPPSAGLVQAPQSATRSAPVIATVPVSVPAGLPFELDVVPVSVTPDPAAPSGSVRDVAAATLAQLPASGGVTLLFDHPQINGHLGAVYLGSPGYLLVNASLLAGDPARTRDVVRHEIAHIYQARLATTLGVEAVRSRLDQVFGPGGLERSADCVAVRFGATWTHYTTDCAGPDRVAAVDALVAGRMP